MEPSLGRIVHYRLDDTDVAAIHTHRRTLNGTAKGTPVQAGDLVALLVTSVWPDDDRNSVNGQAVLDGNHSLWVAMAAEGTGPGCWQWPARVGGG